MSGLSVVEKRALEALLAKKAEAERNVLTPEQLMLKNMEEASAKLNAKMKHLKLGAYGDVADPKKLDALRKLMKAQGNLDNLIDGQSESLTGRWTAPSKQEHRDFLATLEAHSTEIAIKTHELMSLFHLTPEDKNKFESDFKDNRAKSKKRQRVYEDLDDGEVFTSCF